MRAKYPVTKQSAKEQVIRAMSLLQLHGATKPGLWYAIDQVLTDRNRRIEQLENALQTALDRWSKRQ